MPDNNQIPTPKEIDALAKLYNDAKANVEKAKETLSTFADQLTEMVRLHGFVPHRATKSRRILGEEYEVTVSKGHSLEVNGTRVKALFAFLKESKLSSLFRKLFRREQVFVLQDEAQETVTTLTGKNVSSATAERITALFHACLDISDKSPTLSVDPRKEEKKPKAKKVEAAA